MIFIRKRDTAAAKIEVRFPTFPSSPIEWIKDQAFTVIPVLNPHGFRLFDSDDFQALVLALSLGHDDPGVRSKVMNEDLPILLFR